MNVPAILLNALTTADNSSLDVIRVGMVISDAACIGLSGWDVIVNKATFDALSLGGGLACIFGAAASVSPPNRAMRPRRPTRRG